MFSVIPERFFFVLKSNSSQDAVNEIRIDCRRRLMIILLCCADVMICVQWVNMARNANRSAVVKTVDHAIP